MEQPLNVAVIGAGIAGLSAAGELSRAGAHVTLFDKSRGPGGRTATRHAPPFDFDHGAPGFEAHDPAFIADLERLGCAARWTARTAEIHADGRLTNARDVTLWVGVPGMNAIAKALAAPFDIELRTRIAALTPCEGRWTLAADSRRSFGPFDAVVVTPPPEQSAALLASAGLGDLARDVARAAMSPCIAGLLGFESAVPLPYDVGVSAQGVIAVATRNSGKPRRPTGESWVVHAAAQWSNEHFFDDDSALAAALTDAWRAVAPSTADPMHVSVHRWRYARATTPLSGPLADASTSIVVCGDWTHATTGVEGAWLAGREAAIRLTSITRP